jgi:hypothetical protein
MTKTNSSKEVIAMITPEEILAGRVLTDLEIRKTPIDVFAIARKEKIKLCPTQCASDFCGRLEYLPELGRFLLFYPDHPDAESNPRIRFSIGHELGHYYIEEHRERLMRGEFHSSESGFICEKELEMQADSFASGLLLPERTLTSFLQSKNREFLTLREVLNLAEQCGTSRECAAIRYAKFAEEKCIVVVSRGGSVVYAISSDDAERIRLLIKRGSQVPTQSSARRATSSITENEIEGNAWVPWTKVHTLSEESIALGYGGLVLTLLAYSKNA